MGQCYIPGSLDDGMSEEDILVNLGLNAIYHCLMTRRHWQFSNSIGA